MTGFEMLEILRIKFQDIRNFQEEPPFKWWLIGPKLLGFLEG